MDFLKSLLPIIENIAGEGLDAILKGDEFGTDAVFGTQMVYLTILTKGQKFVDSTANTLDNAALDIIKEACEDSAREGNFPLPSLVNVG